ncbi:hypothetical protein [Actinomadura parmotrematis]|uniref:LapA family protein n=1 Tax=Actinomadura parmotrematis TaxID=2864039 RepID=A0ABS7FRT0_9ACTN|nr:hypothetical protein [Actinomadura parmotrematis]MBW8482920.1 hypothetical protein [Actinomadura parmotrematis]
MIVVGLVVAVAALVVGGAVVLDNSGTAGLTVFGDAVPGVEQQWQVFLAGALLVMAFTTGVALAGLGWRRSVDVRRELRDLRDEQDLLEAENHRLQAELARLRRNA